MRVWEIVRKIAWRPKLKRVTTPNTLESGIVCVMPDILSGPTVSSH
jgi:hypothetical protein